MANDKQMIRKPSEPGALIAASQFDEIAAIDRTCHEAQSLISAAEAEGNHTLKAFLVARATRALRQLLTADLMQDIMALQGTPLGFKTDKAYPVEVVRDVTIQVMLRGLQVVGNQFNILAGNLYVTKEGFEHRLNRYPGLSNLEIDLEVPEVKGSQALCSCVARWKIDGKQAELACTKRDGSDFRIPVRVNAGMSDDAILGKAKSKLLRRVFERLTGMRTLSLDDRDEASFEPVIDVDQTEQQIEQARQQIASVSTRDQLVDFYSAWKSRGESLSLSPSFLAELDELCKAKAEEIKAVKE